MHGWTADRPPLLHRPHSSADTNWASIPAGAAAVGDGAPLHPGTGRGRHHREAGSEYQAAVALRRSLYQGGPHEHLVVTMTCQQVLTLLTAACCDVLPSDCSS